MSRPRRLVLLLPLLAVFLLAASWQPVAPLPEPRWFHGAALGGDGKIYAMGGYVDSTRDEFLGMDFKSPQQVYGIGRLSLVIYNPTTNTWSRGPAVPKYKSRGRSFDSRGILHESTGERDMHHEAIVSAADAEGRVYWFGGRGFMGPLRFNPRTGAWEQPSIPIVQQGIYQWDPVAKRGIIIQPELFIGSRPTYVRLSAAAATGPEGKIYIVGGLGHRIEDAADHRKIWRLLGSLEVYDPATDTWTEKAHLQQPRQLHAAAFGPDGKLYVFGGTEVAGGVMKEPNESWESYEARVADMRRKAATALTSVEAYDPKTNTWEYRSPLPVGKENLAAARGADGRIYLLGGTLSYSNPVPQKTVEIYDPRTDTWTAGPPSAPSARAIPPSPPPMAASTPSAAPPSTPSSTPGCSSGGTPGSGAAPRPRWRCWTPGRGDEAREPRRPAGRCACPRPGLGLNVRLCKGAYREPGPIAYPRKRDVDASFLRLAERLLAPDSLARGTFAAFATHDPRMVAAVRRLAAARGVPRDRFEFQMLYGIGRDLQKALTGAGYPVRIYLPYGDAWFPYFMRRLAERPANLLFLLRSLLRG